jgi:drug/metabolite transporter (DMT)-like permease
MNTLKTLTRSSKLIETRQSLSIGDSRLANNRFLLVAVFLTLDSLHFVFARLLLPHISPGVSAMYVLAVGAVEVGLFGLIRRRLHLRTLARHPWFFLSVGFLVGTSTNINYEAVAFIDPGTATLLSRTSILFGLAFGLFWLGEKLTAIQMVGAMGAAAGAFIIVFQPGSYLQTGSLLVLSSALMYALHAAIVKRYGGRFEFSDFFFFRLLCTTGFLFLSALGRRALVWPSARAWTLLILVGTVDVTISRALYYLALRRLNMSVHSIVLAFSPAAAVLWSLLLFDTMPTVQQLLGGGAVILGVLMVTVPRNT